MYLDGLAEINGAWLHRDPKSLSLTNNAKLDRSGRHQSRSKEVSGSIPTEGKFFAEFILLSLQKLLLQHCQLCISKGKTDHLCLRMNLLKRRIYTVVFLLNPSKELDWNFVKCIQKFYWYPQSTFFEFMSLLPFYISRFKAVF